MTVRPASRRTYFALFVAPFLACQGGGQTETPAGIDAGAEVDGAQVSPTPDAAPTSSCPEAFIGSGDGCDCGCGIFDPDCPMPLAADDCFVDNCGGTGDLDPADPTQCIPTVVPAGWTCSTYRYGDDGVCSCGCGALDDRDCDASLSLSECYTEHGCPTGSNPDPNDPTQCTPSPVGWTCHFSDYYDASCDCGCGIADPSCPANTQLTDCQFDGCPAGQSPNPAALTTCMSNAPQDHWSCDLALLLDGSQCDCGCGALDPDCPAGGGPDSCDVVHCGGAEELKPGTIAECWELCVPTNQPVGNATCTNGGFISIFSACGRHLSACSDGHTYEVECDAGECVCRVDGQCVGHATGGCSLNFTCGWSLIDDT